VPSRMMWLIGPRDTGSCSGLAENRLFANGTCWTKFVARRLALPLTWKRKATQHSAGTSARGGHWAARTFWGGWRINATGNSSERNAVQKVTRRVIKQGRGGIRHSRIPNSNRPRMRRAKTDSDQINSDQIEPSPRLPWSECQFSLPTTKYTSHTKEVVIESADLHGRVALARQSR
jgi:hypothetical protein